MIYILYFSKYKPSGVKEGNVDNRQVRSTISF